MTRDIRGCVKHSRWAILLGCECHLPIPFLNSFSSIYWVPFYARQSARNWVHVVSCSCHGACPSGVFCVAGETDIK